MFRAYFFISAAMTLISACAAPLSSSPVPASSSDSPSNGASAIVWTEVEVQTALDCLEASGDITAKTVAGQMKFAFLTGQRAKSMPSYSAESYQQSMNDYGAGLSRLKASSSLNATASACISK